MSELKEVDAVSDVDHPAHYNKNDTGVECIDVVEFFGFNLGNALKYIWRADHKGAAVRDYRKAAWYVEREILRRKTETREQAIRREMYFMGHPLARAAVSLSNSSTFSGDKALGSIFLNIWGAEYAAYGEGLGMALRLILDLAARRNASELAEELALEALVELSVEASVDG